MSIATNTAPRAVFSVLDGAYRDIAVADDAVAGTFVSTSRRFALGPAPDWTTNPYPDDKEWRVEWVKFYYGLDLAHAFTVTQDHRYLDTWIRLVESFVAQVSPGADDTEVSARRIQNWIYAWNRFSQASGDDVLPNAVAARIVDHLWREVMYVRAHLTKERNHRTLELYALFVAALAFPHLDPGQALRDFGFRELHANLLADILPDGVHREGSTHYHCIVLRSFLGALLNARLAGMTVPTDYLTRVTRAAEFALHCHRPDGRIPACSDADSESYRDVLRLAGLLLDRPDLLWGASLGEEGSAPAARLASFPVGGYYTQRSGWGTHQAFANEQFLIFDCGPLGDGGHGHYDALSVEIAASGSPLLVDPGRYTYSEAGTNWRHWFKGTAAHNTVVVDGLDQTPYSRRKPKGRVATGALLARASAAALDLIVGTCTSPAYDAVHSRSVVYVPGEYWIVCDHLQADTTHRYDLRWHFSPEAGATARVRPDAPARVEAASIRLSFAPEGRLRLEEGWVAPAYGVKVPAPVSAFTVHGTCTTLVTVIDPSPAPDTARTARIIASGHAPEALTIVEIAATSGNGACVDTVAWSSRVQAVHLGGFDGSARAVWTRTDSDGQCLATTALDVHSGTWTHPTSLKRYRLGDGRDGLSVSWTAGRTDLMQTRVTL